MKQTRYPLFLVTLVSAYYCHAQQESTLRPRVQLAQLKSELDDILSVLNVSTAPEAHRAIKQLQHQVRNLETKNKQLTQELESVTTKYTQTSQRNAELTRSMKRFTHTKQQITSLTQQLTTVAERLSADVP